MPEFKFNKKGGNGASKLPAPKPILTKQQPVRSTQQPVRTSQQPVRNSQELVQNSQELVRTSQDLIRTSQQPVLAKPQPVRTSQELKKGLSTSVKASAARESYQDFAANILNLSDNDDLEETFVSAARVSSKIYRQLGGKRV